jgi:hypothetical protein
MAPERSLQIRPAAARALTLLVALTNFVAVSHGVDYMVGGDVQKWNFPPSSSWYDDVWAKNITFYLGDTLST